MEIRYISARLENLRKGLLFVMGLVLNCVVGVLDYFTGSYIGMEIFYLLPISFVSSFIGRKAGIFMSLISAGTLVLADTTALRKHYTGDIFNPLIHLGMFIVFTFLISGIKRALREISASKNILASILESAGEGIYGIDANGNHTIANQEAVRMLGYDADWLIGKYSHSIWHHTRSDGSLYPPEECRIYATLRDGVVKHVTDEVYWKKDGTSFPVDYTVAPIWENDKITGAVIVFRDVTELKLAEEHLRKVMADLARSNKDLEQFAYAISHDLQAPLRSMGGFAQILVKDYKGKIDEEADKYIGHIINGAKRMQRMIEDILKFSRVGTPPADVQTCDFEAALSQAMANLHAAIDERAAVITHDPLPEARADGQQMILLFQNLLGNAIKFAAETPRVHVSAVRSEREWIFSVQDNGIGIDWKQHDRLFILFQRLHTEKEYPGTGVGLAICKKIVDRHGGRIWVESEPGKGSHFFFTIPLM